MPQPLYYASSGGLRDIEESFLGEGADVNAQGDDYGNALQAALAGGHIELRSHCDSGRPV